MGVRLPPRAPTLQLIVYHEIEDNLSTTREITYACVVEKFVHR